MVETTGYIDKTYANEKHSLRFQPQNAKKIDNDNTSHKNVQRYITRG